MDCNISNQALSVKQMIKCLFRLSYWAAIRECMTFLLHCVSQCFKAITCVYALLVLCLGMFFLFFFCFHFRLCFHTTGTNKQCNQLQKLLSKWIQGVCSDPNRVPTQVSYCHVMFTDFRVFFFLFFFFRFLFPFFFFFFFSFPLCERKEDVALSAATPQY